MSQKEHSFASPGPAALGALAVACFAFFAILTGKVSHAAAPIVACWLIGGAVCQIIAGIIELKDHNISGGNVMLFFGAFFMLVSALSLSTKYGLHTAGLHFDSIIEGWCWLAAWGFLVLMTPCYLKAPRLLFWGLVLADIAVLFIALIDLKVTVLPLKLMATVAGWCLLGLGFIGLYLAGAIAINTTFGKTILSTTSPYMK
ncbi:MAG TPA: hypothetical protein ENG51_22415 [Deltaproteobacteria bacterium]|nr:hypothetical protein [Deltaproteobacteria bacterium]